MSNTDTSHGDLITANVYIDASVYYQMNFDWSGEAFKRFEALAKEGTVRLFYTEITRQEVYSLLTEKVESAIESLRGTRRATVIFSQLEPNPFAMLQGEVNKDQLLSSIQDAANAFFARCNAVLIDAYSVSSSEIFEDYFSRKPPFGAGKKRKEFPDAFVIAGLRSWCSARQEQMYVVSKDDDLRNCCGIGSPLIAADSILTIITSAQIHADLLQQLSESVAADDTLKKIIKEKFEWLGFVLADEDGDVNAVDVVAVEIEDVFVLKRDGSNFDLDLSARISYNADVSYGNMDTAVWDSEDRVAIPLQTVEMTINRDEHLSIPVKCTFESGQPAKLTILDVDLPGSKDIDVYATDEDSWY